MWSLFSRLRFFRMSKVADTHKTQLSITYIVCNVGNHYQFSHLLVVSQKLFELVEI